MIPKNILIDFDSLKVGDKVWDSQKGKMTLVKIVNSHQYPLKFENKDGYWYDYAKGGKLDDADENPSLFLSNPFDLISEYPKEMWVSDDKIEWEKSKIVYFNENHAEQQYLDTYGNHWNYAKDIESEPPSITISMEEAIEELSKLKGKQVIIK